LKVRPQFARDPNSHGQKHNVSTIVEGTTPIRTGTPAASTATNLVRGWNLLGPARSVGLPQHASILNTLWWWDGQEYQLAAELLPGRGYWIYAATETVPVDLGQ
jgi:hypothetical protein